MAFYTERDMKRPFYGVLRKAEVIIRLLWSGFFMALYTQWRETHIFIHLNFHAHRNTAQMHCQTLSNHNDSDQCIHTEIWEWSLFSTSTLIAQPMRKHSNKFTIDWMSLCTACVPAAPPPTTYVDVHCSPFLKQHEDLQSRNPASRNPTVA
jgi:hypothetical protein